MIPYIVYFPLIASVLGGPTRRPGCSDGPHIITVRETSASPWGGKLPELVQAITDQLDGSDWDDIPYPATWHDPLYSLSEAEGVVDTTAAIESYAMDCPSTDIILLGYSQGAQVILDVLCGTSETGFNETAPLPWSSGQNVKAVVLMGDTSHIANIAFDAGTSTKDGRFPRKNNTECASYTGVIRSYCDMNDIWCDSGDNQTVHESYVSTYKSDAVDFAVSKVKN
ncbi:uncharacterized protein LDX57_006627 [Aspergillus melleus]|uniref:uncharacterized protein n=1 Tax=Aspergillus melleus TaxID=138277 RepID=UPI001E8CAB34|nr:uncharacterized protein LDX57_006627 [Aspergillus melleus]KAH8428954.1 hypothetical protein LDX57_006627 [Aspergillus melleus]